MPAQHHKWLSFFTVAAVGAIVFALFIIRLQPVKVERNYSEDIIPGSLDEPTVTVVNPRKGAKEPRVRIIEFGDFQCDACQLVSSSLDVALRAYPEDIQIVWKDLPNDSLHPEATPAAIAAHCAAKQGAFWQYHDALFTAQSILGPETYAQIAKELGLDETAWSACYEAQETLPIVQRDLEEGIAMGIPATPAVLIGDERVVGAITTEELLQRIADALKE